MDVLKPVEEVEGAFDRVGEMVLRAHLKDHVATAHERGDVEEIVEELMEALKYR